MSWFLRLFAIGFIYAVTCVAWVVLGGVTDHRTRSQGHELRGAVADLWGQPQTQEAPTFTAEWPVTRQEVRTQVVDGKPVEVPVAVQATEKAQQSPASTDLQVHFRLDPRRKDLVWYALYDVTVDGSWRYVHSLPRATRLRIAFQFPDASGIYDGFRLEIDGRDRARELVPLGGRVETVLDVAPGQEVRLRIAYRSRGLDTWRYRPADGVANIEKFALQMRTDFAEIDYPPQTLSPSQRTAQGSGWQLDWRFDRVVTGQHIGIAMPQRIQPGELAAALSWSAPVSLLFFFAMLLVLSTLRGLDLHPLNYALLAAAFFAFHLLFAYASDHLEVVPAFALSSVVSLVLVLSYMRLVVSARFALVETAACQLLYLVGFSLAHFWQGMTGLTVTVLAIGTLFAIMQWTGRIRWSERLRPGQAVPQPVP